MSLFLQSCTRSREKLASRRSRSERKSKQRSASSWYSPLSTWSRSRRRSPQPTTDDRRDRDEAPKHPANESESDRAHRHQCKSFSRSETPQQLPCISFGCMLNAPTRCCCEMGAGWGWLYDDDDRKHFELTPRCAPIIFLSRVCCAVVVRTCLERRATAKALVSWFCFRLS